eukprot:CAMPEP_0202461972 /NCGR_PEP_ID=MMETSP1360-20130828/51871_1 /ASSEMBLY_ACC=CAM_ASM_000848 /TAXON_ID=515479 /ORGANISM="Licmophora paradoxa, Strain CCMP2313" /LENGTH=69 /DNA_ID=CAMNT_0049084249 /DNA_START=188 /DNA_END=394 /DNA_ORIENTATION=+
MTSSQKCWDPECRATGFRGERIPLPQDVEEKVGEVLFDFELAAMDLSPRNSAACLKDKSNEKAEEAEPA